MKKPRKTRKLALATLQNVRTKIINEIRAADEAWLVVGGDGNRFCNELQENGQYTCSAYLMATHRAPVSETEDVVVRITLNVTSPADYMRAEETYLRAQVEGETEFVVVASGADTNDWSGWRGWVRRGIDCASVWLQSRVSDYNPNVYRDVAAMLEGELARVAKALAASKTARPVPGYGFSRQPEWFDQARADLKAGRAVSLMPHGFGTGYRFTVRRGSSWDGRAKREFEEAMGVAPLYVQTLDCD